MRLKIISLSLFVAFGLTVGFINVYEVSKPPEQIVEKTVILAGQDLLAEPEAFGVDEASPPNGIKQTAPPLVLKDKVLATKYVAPPPIIVTNKGNNLLVLINKTVRLPSSYVPPNLVALDKSIKTSWSGMQLRREAANALLKMINDAKKKGFKLNVNSTHRSYQTQVATYNYWVSQVGAAEADRFSARPGHSQHQLGTTVDITSASVDNKLVASFGNTPEGKWLAQNGYKYGFVLAYPAGYEHITGYIYEPWHFRYIGVENAKKMKNSGFILELFLKKFGVY